MRVAKYRQWISKYEKARLYVRQPRMNIQIDVFCKCKAGILLAIFFTRKDFFRFLAAFSYNQLQLIQWRQKK